MQLYPFEKPYGTRYDIILGRYLHKVIGIYILNGALAFTRNEEQVTMVEIR